MRGDAAALLEPPHHVTHVVPRHAQPSRLSHTVATSWRKKWTRITTRHAKSSVYAAGIAAGRAPLGARLEAQGSRRRKTGARAPGRKRARIFGAPAGGCPKVEIPAVEWSIECIPPSQLVVVARGRRLGGLNPHEKAGGLKPDMDLACS